jgi:hypothetical protein
MKDSIDGDETVINFIKQSTQQRGQGSTKRDDPSPSQKHTNPKGVTRAKGTKYVPELPPVTRSISYHKKKGKRNLKMYCVPEFIKTTGN